MPVAAISVFVPILIISESPAVYLGSFIGGLLSYTGTVLLGIIAFVQNDKMHQLNNEMREEKDTQNRLLIERQEKTNKTIREQQLIIDTLSLLTFEDIKISKEIDDGLYYSGISDDKTYNVLAAKEIEKSNPRELHITDILSLQIFFKSTSHI